MYPVRRSRRQGAGRRARAPPGLWARLPGTANRSDLGQDSNKETSASCRLARQGSAGWTEGGRQVSSGPGGVQAPDRRQARPHFVIFNTDFQTVSLPPSRTALPCGFAVRSEPLPPEAAMSVAVIDFPAASDSSCFTCFSRNHRLRNTFRIERMAFFV